MVADCRLGGVDVARPHRGDNCAVIGCGPITILSNIEDRPENLNRLRQQAHFGLHESFRLRKYRDLDVESRVCAHTGGGGVGGLHKFGNRGEPVEIVFRCAFDRESNRGHPVRRLFVTEVTPFRHRQSNEPLQQGGRLCSVGGTILTDTAVLIILAVVVGMHRGALDQSFWIQLGISLAIFSAIVFGLIPKFARWFFRKLESEKHAHYIFVLAIVFFAAFLAEVAGVEPIIGAFAAGLALNPLIPHTSALMNRIEFMGNALFIPFFLISVGMIVDLSVIFKGIDAWIIALTLTAVALSSKWLAALATQLVFRFSSAQRQLIFGLSSAHAAATIAVIMVGYTEGILDEAVLNGTIVLILLTSLASTLATERAGKKILQQEPVAPVSPNSEVEHVVVPNLRKDKSAALLELAMALRTSSKAKPITMLRVMPNDEKAEDAMAQAQEELRQFVRQGAAAEVPVQPHVSLDFNVSSGIARASRELQATSVVLDWLIKPSLVNSIFGESVSNVVEKIDRNVFLCRMIEPLVTVKRMVLLCPPLSERENGFDTWMKSMSHLCRQQSLELLVVSNEASYRAVTEVLKTHKMPLATVHEAFDDWEDVLVATRFVRLGDLVVVASGRLGSPSYMPYMDALPNKMSKYLVHQNLVVVYPKPFGGIKTSDAELMQGSPLTKGYETIEQLGKGLFGAGK